MAEVNIESMASTNYCSSSTLSTEIPDEKEEHGSTQLATASPHETDGSDTSDDPAADKDNNTTQKLSKKQRRNLKKQRKWLLYKDEKRAKEREKKKQRRKEAHARGEDLGPSRKKLKLNSMAKSNCKVSVAIDCSLDSYMGDRDIMKMSQQLQFSYSANRRAANPVQFHVCGITGQLKTRLDGIGDYKNWDIHHSEKNYLELFEKSSIVYLSSDSPNVLHDLDPEKVYIIGGLVDHNHHKGLCHKLAEEKGVAHAQLPISEFIELKTRKVLTINHVFEILLKFTETKDWQKAFFSVLPQRKGVLLKDDVDVSETSANSEKVISEHLSTENETSPSAQNENKSEILTENLEEDICTKPISSQETEET